MAWHGRSAPSGPGRALLGCLRAHPDALGLALVAGLALFFRAQFVFRAPMFMQHDSLGYILPAWELANGEGFGVGFRRTPVYPFFLAGVLSLFGPSLSGVLIVQHLLGVGTAVLTWWLGRLTFGRLAGLLGGLLVAVNGALIVGEHYLMSEGLFVPLLALALLALLRAARQPGLGRCLLAGALLALAALCRPIAQALFPLAPLALLLLGQPLRQVVRGSLLIGLGVTAILLPWTLRTCLTAGECSTTGVLGQAMLARTAYYDKGFVFYDADTPGRGADAPRPAIRRLVQRLADQDSSGGVIARRLQAEFKWSDAETARMTREVAFEVIQRQPLHYLTGTLEMFGQIAGGEFDRLRTDWKTQGRRFSRNEWDERVAPLLANPTPWQEAEFPRAEAMVSFWQPVYWRPWLPLLALAGFGLALGARGPARGAAVLGLAALLLMLAAAAFDGPVPRYRYPADPYLALLAAGGALGLARLVVSGFAFRVSRGRGPVSRFTFLVSRGRHAIRPSSPVLVKPETALASGPRETRNAKPETTSSSP